MVLKRQRTPILLSLKKIWDKAPHNAMTDLILFKNTWLCTFREGQHHARGTQGRIRIIASSDTMNWRTVAFFEEEGVDLRDPKLSITPDGRLMLLAGGTIWGKDQEYIQLQARVAFSSDTATWTSFTKVLEPHQWLWRAVWHNGIAYGVAYGRSDPADKQKEWLITLCRSSDGVQWEPLVPWNIEGYPNEATIRFSFEKEMIALVRREGKDNGNSLIGVSEAPYTDWHWKTASCHLGGPNFIILPKNVMWAGGRIITNTPCGLFEKTVLATMTSHDLEPCLCLPSGGDCSYPGMVFHDSLLWMSYYSSHETHASIYLARIAV